MDIYGYFYGYVKKWKTGLMARISLRRQVPLWGIVTFGLRPPAFTLSGIKKTGER